MAEIFQPVRGTESAISQLPIREGYVYFAYDSGNIYLDKQGTRYTIGGGASGIAYTAGNVNTIIKNSPDDTDYHYTIKYAALEDTTVTLKPDTLILNADGRFFRVLSADPASQEIQAVLLAVSGTGGGSGGGGGGGESPSRTDVALDFNTNTINSYMTFVYGQDSDAEFTPKAEYDNYVNLLFEVVNATTNEKVFETQAIGVPVNKVYKFNMGQIPSGENLLMTVTLISPNSLSHPTGFRKQFTGLNIVELGIAKDNSQLTNTVLNGAATVNYFIKGGNSLALTIYPSIDGILADNLVASVNPGTTVRSVRIPAQPHGVHTISLKLGAAIRGNVVYSDEISYELAWADPNESTPLIWVQEYADTVIQYEKCVIKYMVYDPAKVATGSRAEVQLIDSILNEEIATVYPQYSSSSIDWLTWDLTESYHVGANRFLIQCGTENKEINFNVTTEGSRDLGLVDSGALILNLSSAGRSNEESAAKRAAWGYNYEDEIITTTTFKDFNWYNNGWKNDNDGAGSYLSVANGASADINFTTMGFNTQNQSYTIELRFRVKNIQEYSTLVKTLPYYFVLDENGVQMENSMYIEDIKAQGLTIATDKDGNWIMDEANSPKITEHEKGVCFKYYDEQTKQGLFVGTQEAYFKTPDTTVNVRYKEDEIISLTITAEAGGLLSLYLNGILSGAVSIGNNGFTPNTNKFEINSKYCDFDIYKLRVYRGTNIKPLTMPEVIHNYISDIHDLTLYDQNQLTKDDDATALSLGKIKAYNDLIISNLETRRNQGQVLLEEDFNALMMPYAVIEIIDNDTSMRDPTKTQRRTDDDRLPYIKDGNRYCKITFVNAVADALLEFGMINEETYYSHCPSYVCIGADINVQGTSSQGYPRRNFKTKMKSATGKKDAEKVTHDDWGWFYTKGSKAGKSFKKWSVDNNYAATNKFTWKIDFMESSGTYNTGFANLMGKMYDYHPLNDYNFDGVSTAGFRTSVYGFPLLVFHQHSKPSDKQKIGTSYEDEIYEYIGRYNMNLDKGSNEYYGFEVEGEQKYITLEDGTHPAIADIAECWELCDNQGTWTSFTYPSDAEKNKDVPGRNDYYFGTYEKDSYDANGNPVAEPKLEVINHFEYRYSAYGDELDACYDYDVQAYPEELGTFGQINQYLRDKYRNLEAVTTWLDSTNTAKATNEALAAPYGPVVVSAGGENIPGEITYIENNGIYSATYYKDTPAYRLAKFRTELPKHFNVDYCAIYYVLTELLLCYDSRGKNMMLATWGPKEVGGDYIWYPIFYDIDTQLGLNNIGATLWDYDTDASKDGTFSTPSSILWVNFAATYETKIINTYKELRASKLTETNIEGAYLCDPSVFDSYAMRGVRPVIAIGLDEYVKYLKPSIAGYYNTKGEVVPDSYGYVYAINGDRMLSRELLIRNRLNYLDSYWRAGDYSTEVVSGDDGCVIVRANANAGQTSDLFLDSNSLSELPSNANAGSSLAPYPVEYLDAIPEYTITPFLKQYVFTFIDKIPSGRSVKFQGEPVQAYVSESILDGFKKTPNLSQQITRIPGPSYISSLGDLSTKYFDQFQIPSAKRLLDLTLGSDIEGYYNGRSMANFILNDSLKTQDGSSLNVNRKTLLQKVILTNMTQLNYAIDVSGSEKLQEFRALGTIIQGVVFAEGAPLDTVHLPKTVNGIGLVEAKNLTHILTSTPKIRKSIAEGSAFYPHESYEGLYLEGITDVDDSAVTLENQDGQLTWKNLGNVESASSLINIKIVGGNLKYDSYKLLRKAIVAKEKIAASGTRLKINLENIDWCPYTQLSVYDEYDSNTNYYQVTDHSTFVPYTYDENTWQQLLLNGKIYTYEYSPDQEIITSLDLLDFFLQDYENGLATTTHLNHYTNMESSTAALPRLTGVIYVENTEQTPIQEDTLTSVYAEKWPELTIFAKYVRESNIVKYVQATDDGRENELSVIRLASTVEHPVLTTVVPSKAHYDFIGWSTDIAGNNMFLNYDFENRTYPNAETELAAFTYTMSQNVLVLYAQFKIHEHNVYYYVGDELIGGAPVKVPYNTALVGPSVMPYKDDSDLALTRTYKFNGYSMNSEDTTEVTQAPPAIVLRDLNLYATFVEADVHDNIITDMSWFNFSPISQTLSVAKAGLTGKITLPAQYNGQDVLIFATAGIEQPGVTHIFWERGSKVNTLSQSCFAGKVYSNLMYFEIPVNNFTVPYHGFSGCTNLFKSDKITQEDVDNFFGRIIAYGENAFAQTSPNFATDTFLHDKELRLPGNVVELSNRAFSSTLIRSVRFGNVDDPFTLDPGQWGTGIFQGSGYGQLLVSTTPVPVTFYYNPIMGLDSDTITNKLSCGSIDTIEATG